MSIPGFTKLSKILMGMDRKKVIITIIFAALTFTFLHSEFEFFNYDGNDHSSHDFCTLVKYSSNSTTKASRNIVFDFKFEKVVPAAFNEVPEILCFSINQYKSINFTSLKTKDWAYLFNCILLI